MTMKSDLVIRVRQPSSLYLGMKYICILVTCCYQQKLGCLFWKEVGELGKYQWLLVYIVYIVLLITPTLTWQVYPLYF